jgi:predicted nucleic-acid-binding protein
VIAVDTNVVVRLVTNDDPVQSPRAAKVFAEEDVHISKTVVLEMEWVLRAAYDLPSSVIRNAIARLMAVPSVMIEDAPAVAGALTWYAAGLDFADALHVASSGSVTGFVTYDKTLVKRAKKVAAGPRVTLL